MTRKEYIIKYAPFVISALKGTKLFPSVMMAQALIESSNKAGIPGESLLASKYNNHFGIKADASWVGDKIDLKTTEYVKGVVKTVKAWFRVYEHAHHSFEDRIVFLTANPRYQKGGVFNALDASQQTLALQRSGYATDPAYASKLMSLITRLGLEELDKIGADVLDLVRFINRRGG
ncbi:glucosaminidase domain-containing protein [Chryseolinea sp. T2]|uniref:glycoside hydrolase family 73 protein n=1 Tax=Chryseolinea sp. T2 TaxID=3129255 RepID=UPI0030771FD2